MFSVITADNGSMVQLEIAFLVVPVRQPIISIGKLYTHMGVSIASKNDVYYLMVEEDACELN